MRDSAFGNPNRKYCGRDCYVKDRFWTDPDEKPSAAEIKRRQQEAEKSEDEVKLILKRIS